MSLERQVAPRRLHEGRGILLSFPPSPSCCFVSQFTTGQTKATQDTKMARGPRGNKGGNGSEGNGRSKRATPYDGARANRKGGDRNNNNAAGSGKGKDGGRGRNDGKGNTKGGKDGGRGRGGRGGGRGGEKPKPRTAEDLDREMDSYWGKSEEHAAKKLDSDMDDYWKTKGQDGNVTVYMSHSSGRGSDV